MGNRDITWACSRCSATFSTRAGLAAHLTAAHGPNRSKSPPILGLAVRPSVSAVPAGPPAKGPRQADARSLRQPEADAPVVEVRQTPPVAASVPAKPSAKELPQPDASLERQPEPHERAADLARQPAPDAPVVEVRQTPPVAPAMPAKPSAMELPQPDAGLARRSAPDVPAASLARRPEPPAPVIAAREAPSVAPALQPARRSPSSDRRTLLWFAVAVLCVAAVGIGSVVRHQIAPALTRQPTPFTQLYFSDPDSLPKALRVSLPNRFSFTVVNREGHDSAYAYVVTLATSSGSSTVAEGRIDLRNGRGATIGVDVSPTRRATEYVVTVSLVGRAKMIRFRAASP